MTTDGGNWKEMVRAATAGDITILKYHLENGIDPNFQHPEFMTTAILEAIRGRQKECVEILLDDKADPTIVSDLEGTSPMELALQTKQHEIVDILLKVLPSDYENECLTIWMTGTYHRDLVSQCLDKGHCVVATVEEEDQEESKKIAEALSKETGNQKLWITTASSLKDFFATPTVNDDESISSSSAAAVWHPSTVDVWVYKPTDARKILSGMVCQLRKKEEGGGWTIPFRNIFPKILILLESKTFVDQHDTQQQLAWLLQKTANGKEEEDDESSSSNTVSIVPLVSAMLEPTTWWDNMTYSFWYQTWCENLLGLLVELAQTRNYNRRGGGGGKAYTYNRQSLVLSATTTTTTADTSLVDDWKRDLDWIASALG